MGVFTEDKHEENEIIGNVMPKEAERCDIWDVALEAAQDMLQAMKATSSSDEKATLGHAIGSLLGRF